ncbi:MAG: hypothetical protein ACRD3V_33820, partial [Vicinamibacteria bacterium]
MGKVAFLLALSSLTSTVGLSGAQAKTWLGKSSEFENFLKTAEVAAIDALGEGANEPKKLTLTQGGRTLHGLWKPIERGNREWGWESYQAEIAAYEIDQLLGLDMVPPTVVREVNGVSGSLQLWVEGCRLYRDVRDQTPVDPARWERQIARMKLFDNLISNWDRSEKNFLVDSDWRIVLIDHSQAFLSTRELSPKEEQLPSRFERRLVEELRRLEPEFLRFHFGRLLLDPQISAISA